MNAQEAIENEQIELDELKSELKRREFLVHAVNDDGLLNARTFQIEQVKTIEKMIEQKSIVLESAKKLHQDSLIRKFKDDNGEPMVHVLLGNSYDREEAAKMGFEVEK